MEDRGALDIQQIASILPHRYPFLLIDRVTRVDLVNDEIDGLKNVTVNEPFFGGHFPGIPLMPGVLIVEAMAQLGGILVHQKGFGHLAVLLTIREVKFRRRVVPGDQLVIKVKGIHLSPRGGKVHAVASVDNQVAAEGEVGFALVNKDQLSS